MKILRSIVAHVVSWLEAYFWAPAAILSVIGAAHLYYALTGRVPADPPDFIPEMAGRFVLAVLAIVLTSISVQAVIGWPNDTAGLQPGTIGKMPSQCIQVVQKVITLAILILWAYVLSH